MENNLSQMVKKTTPIENVFTPTELDIPEAPEENIQSETTEAQAEVTPIKIVSLISWIGDNVDNFPNIRTASVSVQGVDADEQLIITVPTPTSEIPDKRKIIVFDNAHQKPVLDLEAIDMQIYTNGFRIIYDLGNQIFIKSYGLRIGLISVFCYDVNDVLIPFTTIRSKKRDTELETPEGQREEILGKLQNELDFETFQLRYKQSSKAEGLTTNLDAIKWLVERQGSIEDTNHHLQIDNVIIDTLT